MSIVPFKWSVLVVVVVVINIIITIIIYLEYLMHSYVRNPSVTVGIDFETVRHVKHVVPPAFKNGTSSCVQLDYCSVLYRSCSLIC